MIKQLVINGLKSYDDFGMCISTRKISQPKKKSIKDSVPFSNKVHDFSKIDGEIYWEERTLEYTFDIAEFTTDEMEEVKTKVLDWLMNVHDADIYDPFIGDYHFHGSFESDSWEEDFGGGTLGFAFTVYPYKIANFDTTKKIGEIGVSDDGIVEGNYSIAGLKVDGKSEQEITTNNLFVNTWAQGGIGSDDGVAFSNSTSIMCDYIEVFPNYLYTLTRTIYNAYMTFRFYDKDKNYLGYQTTEGMMTSDQESNRMIAKENQMTFTLLNQNVRYMRIVDNSNDLSTIYKLTTSCPSPDYPSEVKSVEISEIISCGKNLFNINNVSYLPSYHNIYPIITAQDSNNFTMKNDVVDDWQGIYIENLNPSKTYTISFDVVLTSFNNEKNITVNTDKGSTNMNTLELNVSKRIVYTFTNSNKIYIRQSPKTINDYSNVQLEIGSVATSYESYKETTTPLELILRSLPNGVCDTFENGVITRKVGKVVLNGSEGNWYVNSASVNPFRIRLFDATELTKSQSKPPNIYCDRFEPRAWNGDNTNIVYLVSNTIDNVLYFRNNDLNKNLTEWKTWLSENNITVLYELATPIIETIDLPIIKNYSSKTVISLDSDVETTFEVYYNDTKTLSIYNDSSHRISPKIEVEGNMKVALNDVIYSFGSGVYEDSEFYLEKGLNNLSIVGYGSIKFTFKGEKF